MKPRETTSDSKIASKHFRSVSGNFDSITISIEQFQHLDTITLEDLIATLKMNEDKLKDRLFKREEKALLPRAEGKTKKKDSPKVEVMEEAEEELNSKLIILMMIKNPKKKKSKVTCYNCQGKGHHANEC